MKMLKLPPIRRRELAITSNRKDLERLLSIHESNSSETVSNRKFPLPNTYKQMGQRSPPARPRGCYFLPSTQTRTDQSVIQKNPSWLGIIYTPAAQLPFCLPHERFSLLVGKVADHMLTLSEQQVNTLPQWPGKPNQIVLYQNHRQI